MPKVHEEAGCQIYVNTRGEHNPRHVHVVVGDGSVVIELDPQATVLRRRNIGEGDVRKAQRIVKKNHNKLLKEWDKVFKDWEK